MLYAAKHFHKFYPQRQQARPFRQTFFLVWVRVKRIASSLRLEHADDDDAAAVAVAAEALQTHTHAVLCAANSSYRVQTIVCVLPVPLPAERLYTIEGKFIGSDFNNFTFATKQQANSATLPLAELGEFERWFCKLHESDSLLA